MQIHINTNTEIQMQNTITQIEMLKPLTLSELPQNQYVQNQKIWTIFFLLKTFGPSF